MNKVFILIAAFVLLNAADIYSQNGTNKKEISKNQNLNAETIIEKYKPALISIWFNNKNYYSYYTNTYIDTTVLNGSGFIFNESGLIGTNYHVVENIDSLIVKTSDGTFYNAELILVDESNDFAIIRLLDTENKIFPVINFGNSDELKAGQDVFAIGSPLGFEYTISSGIIAAVRNNEKVSFSDPATYTSKEKTFEKVIQITAAISPGNSGGALFNSKGEVIGITTYTYSGYGNLNFAIASNTFTDFITLAETKDYDNSEELKTKKEESQFNVKYNSATTLKSQLSYDWYYTKMKDTMKVVDSLTLRLDSINKINFSKAEKYYNECMEMKPDTFIVYQDLLDLYVLTDNFYKADELYKNIRLKFDSDSLLNLLSSNLATAYSTSKDYGKAILFYEKMLKQDTTQYFIYFQLANIYQETGDFKRALKEYDKLLMLDSNYNEAYFKIGKIYYSDLNNKRKAKHYFKKAYEKELLLTGAAPYNADLYYYMGMIAVDEGKKLEAILAYMELKNVYTYNFDDNEKKIKLYNAISKMQE